MRIQLLILPVFAIFSTLTSSVLSVHVPSSFTTSNRFSQVLFGVAQPDIWDVMKKGAPALQKYALDLFQSAASTAGALAPRVNEIKSLVEDVFDEVTHLHGQINMPVQASGLDGETLDRISEEIDQAFQKILHQVAREFPPTDQAASHDERTRRVADLLEKAREALVSILCEKYHVISEADFMDMWLSVSPKLQTIFVTTGDLAEQHPQLVTFIVTSAVFMIIPESWFLRPLYRLFGFGPLGPVKGSPAAWIQRTFYGAEIPAKSFFSHMQRASMKYGTTVFQKLIASLAIALGVVATTPFCFRSLLRL